MNRETKDLEIILHDGQLAAYQSDKRIIALISGIQGGKTFIGSLWMARQCTIYDAPGNNFLVVAPNYKMLEKGALPNFLRVMEGAGGDLNRGRMTYTLPGGGKVWFASMTDDDSIEGMTNVCAIWCDEAGLLRYNSWINVIGRSSFKQCQIFISTTPYSLNWLYSEVYMKWKTKARTDIELVQFRSVDNPYFPKEEFELQKKLLDPRDFARKYCGTFTKMAGLVYPDVDQDNESEPFKVNSKEYYISAGVDLGYTDEFAVAIIAIRYDGKYAYQIGEVYKRFVDPVAKTKLMQELHKRYAIEAFWCDSADPAMISMFAGAGLPAYAVKKGPDSIKHGIGLVNALIRQKIYKMFNGLCTYTKDEFEVYHYPEDDKTNELEPNPVDFKNHLMDAIRYCIMSTQWVFQQAEEDAKQYYRKTRVEELADGSTKDNDWYNN
jgi:PBSX family phage terminase large subunit